jgi:hypothetical protein
LIGVETTVYPRNSSVIMVVTYAHPLFTQRITAMHSNFNDLKTTKMEAKEWFEKSEYQYALDEYDEGGYLGIDENKVCQMLEEYHQTKLKLLGIGDVVGRSEQLCSCEHEDSLGKIDGLCKECWDKQ